MIVLLQSERTRDREGKSVTVYVHNLKSIWPCSEVSNLMPALRSGPSATGRWGPLGMGRPLSECH
jgi:hypothetical protein